MNRIAGAPISWGVCEVPGWGYQLDPARVLAEMRDVGLTATEFGPEGFLPSTPDAVAKTLDQHDLHAVGGFTPLLLHRPDHDPVPEVATLLQTYAATGSDTLVLSAVTGLDGYDERPALDETGWPRWPPSTRCAPCCTRTSGPWCRTRTRCSGCWTARRSRSAWTPGTC